jgi:hypothetical protein
MQSFNKNSFDRAYVFLKKHIYFFLALIAFFLFWVHPNIGIYDWSKEILYVEFIQQSLFDFHTLPVFLWNTSQFAGYPAAEQSSLFIGNPETLLFSPFTFLLLFLKPILFLKTFVFLNFFIGFMGVIVLARKLKWTKNQERIFSGLFLLSPIIIQHISLGYTPWSNLFLLPWLLLFLVSDKPFIGGIGSGIVLAMILLQGGTHVFVWFSAFLILFIFIQALSARKMNKITHIPMAFIATILMAFPRLFFSFQVFSEFSQRFFSGYSIRGFLEYAMIPPLFFIKDMDNIEGLIEKYIDGVPYWDGAIFWGFILILVIFLPLILYLGNKKPAPGWKYDYYHIIYPVAGASLILLIFSFDGLYQILISFIADLLSVPALEGMEKYPFRFAIISYYGFAFVITCLWPQILVILSTSLEKIKQKIWGLQREDINNKNSYMWRKFTIFFFILFMSIFVLSIVIQVPLQKFMYAEISKGYDGVGNRWISQLMENKQKIPLEFYLSKYDTLFTYFQDMLLISSSLSIVLWILIGNLEKMRRISISILEKSKINLPTILEMLLIIPIVVSFVMWFRVSLATPPTSAPNLQVSPPKIYSTDSTQQVLDFLDFSFSPTSINFFIDDQYKGKKIYFPDIPFSDTHFMEITTNNAIFNNYYDQMGIELLNMEKVNINIILTWYPFIIMFISWFMIIPYLILKTWFQ